MKTVKRWLSGLAGFGQVQPAKSAAARRPRTSGGHRSPSTLAAAAGHGLDVASGGGIETLEKRQMLFTVVVDANSPFFVGQDQATGFNIMQVDFAYAIPFLFKQLPAFVAPNAITTDDLNDSPLVAVTDLQRDGIDFHVVGGLVTVVDVSVPPDAPNTQLAWQVRLNAGGEIVMGLEGDALADYLPMDLLAFAVNAVAGGPGFGTLADLDVELIQVTYDRLDRLAPPPGEQDFLDDVTTNDPDIVQVQSTAGVVAGLNTYQPAQNGNPEYFDAIRIINNGALPVQFNIDNISTREIVARFAQFNATRVFGASLRFAAPDGAAVNVLDLYGREMRATLNASIGLDSPQAIIDQDDNGIPDFNDGIGRISLTGFTATSWFTMVGNAVEIDTEDANGNADVAEFILSDEDRSLDGFYDAFEQAGFGFGLTNAAPPQAFGLPNGAGSVIIGAPFIRDNRTPGAYLAALPTDVTPADLPLAGAGRFTNIPLQNNLDGLPNIPVIRQGLSVDSSIGTLFVHGMVMGLVDISGAARKVNISTLYGSMEIDGDAGAIVLGGDTGVYHADFNDGAPGDNTIATGTRISVGRALGQLHVAGRNFANVIVQGDINNPNRPALSFLNYTELETVFGFNPGAVDDEEVLLRNLQANAGGAIFGNGLYRNDLIYNAEWVGATLRGAVINGTLGNANGFQGTDNADAYAFAARSGEQVTFNYRLIPPPASTEPGITIARVVDARGRVLASMQFPPLAPGDQQLRGGDIRFRFKATRTDTYYLVVGVASDGNNTSAAVYQVTMSGQLNTTAGLVSTGATASGVVTVQNGSAGLIRAGVGRVTDEGGGVTNAAVDLATTSVEAAQDFLAVRGLQVNVAGNLLGILTGSDIRTLSAGITGDFGGLSTGWFGNVDFANGLETRVFGDTGGLSLRVGGSIALIDTPQGFAYQVNGTPLQQAGPLGPVLISSGQSGRPGHIGGILIGSTFNGAAFTLTTSPNSVIDRFIVGTNGTGVIGSFQPTLNLGAGSEIRFANFDRIVVGAPGTNPDTNLVRDINYGESVRFVDDNGTPFLIRITGGVNTVVNPNGSRVRVRFMPVQGSQGVVVARVDAALVAGANLEIVTESAGSVAIGQIRLATDGRGGVNGQPAPGEPPLSKVNFGGPGEIDVLSIISSAAAAAELQVGAAGENLIGEIRNGTRNGDIVSIDIAAVDGVFITGNLGRTQTFGGGDTRLGQFLGVIGGLQNGVGEAIGIAAGTTGNFGATQTPLNTTDAAASLEDIGSPLDGQLDGLIVRNGNVNVVRVDGIMGDVILQGGSITNIVANADNRRATGVFEGIIGTIYALDIGTVDVGDGLLDPGDSPFAEAGIFAVDDIARIIGGTRVKNPVINGVVIAANINALATEQGDATQVIVGDGISQVTFTNAIVDGAFFGAASHDSFWRSIRQASNASIDPGDAPTAEGTVNRITLTGTSLRRSDVFGLNVNEVNITRGVFDASIVQAQNDATQPGVTTGRIRTVRADAFVNTTRDGEPLEYHIAMIRAAGDLETLQTNGRGSISDLFIDVNGNVTKGISAFNISRLILDADSSIKSLKATGDFRSIRVTAGRLESATAANIRSSTFIVAGDILSVTASAAIVSSAFTADGPDGSIGKLSAGTGFSGTVTSSGVITLLESKRGDINAAVVTTQDDAGVTAIKAGRDALISLDTAGDVGTITAARHVGRRVPIGGTIDQLRIDGNLGNITAGGQIYTDIIVGKSITGTLKAGRTFALPNLPTAPDRDRVSDAQIVAFGRINAIAYVGDFAGSITSYSGGIGKITITGGSLRRYTPGVTTVTPSTPVQGIFAHDGNIDSIAITRGHLLGDVIAFDGSIGTISVKGDANFGDIGIDPSKVIADPGNPTGADATLANGEGRFRLPFLPVGANGAGRDGPTIRAKYDIGTVSTTGRIFEAAIQAGRTIRQVTATGIDDFGIPTATPTFIVAGDTVTSVSVSSKNPTAVGGLLIGAGITDLGADNAPGGVGANADTVESGDIGTVSIKGGANAMIVTAGLNAGADGLYNTGDETATPGLSTIKAVSVSGNAAGVSVFADTLVTGVSANLLPFVGGIGAPSAAPVVLGGTGTLVPAAGAIFNINGQNAFIKLSGTGQVFFDDVSVPGQARVILVGTDAKSTLDITPDVGATVFNNLFIVSTDDASLSTLNVGAAVTGALSGMYIDGSVGTVNFATLATPTGAPTLFEVGQSVTTLNIGVPGTGNAFRFATQFLGTANIRGDFGIAGSSPNLTRLDAVNLTTLNVTGDLAGIVSVDRDASRFAISGAVNGGGVRVGGLTQQFSAASLFRARLGFRGGVTTLAIAGNTTESFVFAGTDLGDDARLGGAGVNADTLGNGNIGSATFNGDFVRSDIAAGVVRSSTGFLNTGTDLAAAGRSSIGTVTINGAQVGSPSNSQSFGIASNGTLGNLSVSGNPFNGQIGNFTSFVYDNQPEFLRVSDLRIAQNAGVWTARITFSQGIDASTLAAALQIFEVRGTASNLSVSDRLNGPTGVGADYELSYDPDTFTATIEFSEDIIRRQLTNAVPGADTPQVDGFGNPIASPGTYRFVIDASILRAQVTDQLLDGNSDNLQGDNFVGYQVLGDAGDRLTPFTANTDQATIPFYAPVNLDLLIGAADDPTPDINTSFTVSGGLGDHPFQQPGLFNASGDLDVYTFTLQAGQIFRFSGLRGPAAAGSVVFFRIDTGAPAQDGFQFLPDTGSADPNDGAGFAAQALTSGTFAIAIASTDASGTFVFPPLGPPPIIAGDIVNDAPGALGLYTFDVRISDDGDSGFAGNADPNAGSPLAAPPVPADFVTPDATISVPANVGPEFVYRLRAGTDGVVGTSDDLVVGSNGLGINSTREAGLDGAFGTADDRVLLTSDSGDGMDIITAPLPSDFAGSDAKFGTFDDLPSISREGYTFILDAGANGTFQGDSNSDDLVIGTDRFGNTITRSAGNDRNFGTQDDVVSIGASIGDREVGFGGVSRGDVDVFNLNADSRVPVNTRLRLTLRTSDAGSNLGLQEAQRTPGTFQGELTVNDLRGLVQLAIFDTSAKSNITDGRLIAAPDKINYLDGVPNTVLAKDAFTSYGFDEKGDFYIEFQVPARLDNANVSASLAVYVQGAIQTNYSLEVRNLGVSATPAPLNRTQNVLIETRGGTVDWLEAGRTTSLAGFDASVNGFTGRFNNVAAADYILNSAANPNNLVNSVQAIFDQELGAGRVRVSTDPADFGGEDYTTIYLTSDFPPAPFFNKGNVGEVERVDPFNANPSDEGVIFAPEFNLIGFGSDQFSADLFVNSLAVAVARQVGQLVGLRPTAALGDNTPPIQVMADDSPSLLALNATDFDFLDAFQPLAGVGSANSNTQFFLGTESTGLLLRRIFGV